MNRYIYDTHIIKKGQKYNHNQMCLICFTHQTDCVKFALLLPLRYYRYSGC